MFNFLDLSDVYELLSNRDDPMSISYLLNPSSSPGNTGNGPNGPNGGPSIPHIVIPNQQADSSQSQDPPAGNTNLPSNGQLSYAELGDSMEGKINKVLQDRRLVVENNPINPSGKRARISEIVSVSNLKLSNKEMWTLKSLAARHDFPANFSNSPSIANCTIYSKSLGYSLINFIKAA